MKPAKVEIMLLEDDKEMKSKPFSNFFIHIANIEYKTDEIHSLSTILFNTYPSSLSTIKSKN